MGNPRCRILSSCCNHRRRRRNRNRLGHFHYRSLLSRLQAGARTDTTGERDERALVVTRSSGGPLRHLRTCAGRPLDVEPTQQPPKRQEACHDWPSNSTVTPTTKPSNERRGGRRGWTHRADRGRVRKNPHFPRAGGGAGKGFGRNGIPVFGWGRVLAGAIPIKPTCAPGNRQPGREHLVLAARASNPGRLAARQQESIYKSLYN